MFNKINIFPIIWDHYDTFRVPRTGKYLIRDLVSFIAVPIVCGIGLAVLFPNPSDQFLTLSITVHTLFIPLLVNILFVIYGIQEKQETGAENKAQKLLAELYKNLCYSVLISFVTVAITAATQIASPAFFKDFTEFWNSTAHLVSSAIMYSLVLHLFLTVLMIVRRTHTLLAKDFEGDA